MRARPSARRDARTHEGEGAGTIDAQQLAAQVRARFRVPAGGGRHTDPAWTEKRLVALTPQTLRHLSRVARAMSVEGVTVGPLQVAALLLERAVAEIEQATTTTLTKGRTGLDG
jgi:hypothetical protein